MGRSTFYLHFDTKEELLDSMCQAFFAHVIKPPFIKEKTHDFSHSQPTLKNMVTHVLYHLRDSSSSVYGLLKSDVCHIFYDKLETIFVSWCEQKLSIKPEVPYDLALSYISGNFISSCKWSIKNQFKITPEAVADYYIDSINSVLQ